MQAGMNSSSNMNNLLLHLNFPSKQKLYFAAVFILTASATYEPDLTSCILLEIIGKNGFKSSNENILCISDF